MAFWNKIHNPKVHPLSKMIVIRTSEMLGRHGIVDNLKQARCALELFQATIRNMKVFSKGKNDDEDLARQSDEMKRIVMKYGIESVDEQETIVLEYLEIVGDIGRG